MLLVLGAAGKTGQAVIAALAQRNVSVRAMVYRAEQQAVIAKLGAQEVVIGDMQQVATLRMAMRSVAAVYCICPNMHPQEVAIGRQVITAAQAEGIKHVVYHSVLHPQTQAMPHHWQKLQVEEMLFESGLAYTIVQPAAYMQNILTGWQSIVEQGLYQVPYLLETRLGMVDLQDVAEVVATVLTEPGHNGAIYELAGPDILSQEEIAAILGEVLQQPVRAKQIPRAKWQVQAQDAGLQGYALETLLSMFEYYEQHHFYGNANVLTWLLKRPPTRFRAFVQRVKQNSE